MYLDVKVEEAFGGEFATENCGWPLAKFRVNLVVLKHARFHVVRRMARTKRWSIL